LFERCAPDAFEAMRKVFRYRRNKQSAFYKTFSILFTNEFLRRDSSEGSNRYVMFAVCSQHPSVGNGKPVIGIEFETLTRGDLDIPSLWNEPPINTVESTCIRDAMKDLYPMPPLVVASNVSPSSTSNTLMNRLSYDQSASSSDSSWVEVEYFLSNSLVNESRITQITDLYRQQHVIPFLLKVTVAYECLAESICGWRIVFRCRRASVDTIRAAIKRASVRHKHDRDGDDSDDADDTF